MIFCIKYKSITPKHKFRWRDVADQLYSASYRSSYNYTQAVVEVTHNAVGDTLHGTLNASNLKPNFAYQLKLVGFPGTADNELIGLAGRWWQEEWNGTAWVGGRNLNNKGDGLSPNPNDDTYFSRRDISDPSSPTGLRYRYTGYLVFDYFITDENGTAIFNFNTDSSYHVLWKTTQRSRSASDGPLKTSTFDADFSAAYDDTGGDDYPLQTVSIFGEWERLPVGGVFLQHGDYDATLTITEESFHGSGGSFAGNWAGAMSALIEFNILQNSLTIEAEDATINITGGFIDGGWCLWSNGTLAENVFIPEAGTYEIVVRAYGTPLGGIWPVMALTVDGVEGQTTVVDSNTFSDYVFQVELDAGVHTIGVTFMNDAWNPGVEDRNLYLDRFEIYSPPGVDTAELALN